MKNGPPGKPRFFVPYVRGMGAYRQICEDCRPRVSNFKLSGRIVVSITP